MASQDLQGVSKVLPAIIPQKVTGNADIVGFILDVVDYESVTFCVNTGVIEDGQFTFSLEESDFPDMSNANIISGPDVPELPNLAAIQPLAAAQTAVARRIAYRGSKRYLRLTAHQTMSTNGGTIGATVVLGHPRIAPTPLI